METSLYEVMLEENGTSESYKILDAYDTYRMIDTFPLREIVSVDLLNESTLYRVNQGKTLRVTRIKRGK